MVFWAKELIELAKQVSDKMENLSENCPKDENGNIISGTPEVMSFNSGVFALDSCIAKMETALKEMENQK